MTDAAEPLPKPSVTNQKLKNIVDDLDRGTINPGRVGTDMTADAVHNEQLTGVPTGGKFHSKGTGRLECVGYAAEQAAGGVHRPRRHGVADQGHRAAAGHHRAGGQSALQRARATLRSRLLHRREDSAGAPEVTADEWAVVQRYIAAHQEGDISLADVLAEDVRIAYPAIPLWTDSRQAFIEATREHAPPGEIRLVATTANLQPAVAIYLRPPGEVDFRIVALEVLRVENGTVTEIVDFDPRGLPPAFGLRPVVAPDQLT